jgi:hypothetical protein
VPASNTARFLIFSAVIVVAATIVIIASKGQLGRAKATIAASSDLTEPPTAVPIGQDRVDARWPLSDRIRRVVSRYCGGERCCDGTLSSTHWISWIPT